MVQNIIKLALSFRTKTSLFPAQNDSWHQRWFADPEATEVTEGGDAPTDVPSYLQACKRNNKWFDSFNCFAAAEVLESEVLVSKHFHGQWVYFQKFVPSKCSSKEPIPLFLKMVTFRPLTCPCLCLRIGEILIPRMLTGPALCPLVLHMPRNATEQGTIEVYAPTEQGEALRSTWPEYPAICALFRLVSGPALETWEQRPIETWQASPWHENQSDCVV